MGQLRGVGRLVGEVDQLPRVDGSVVELVPAVAERPVDVGELALPDAGVDRPGAPVDRVRLDRDDPVRRGLGDPRHDVHTVLGTGRVCMRESRDRGGDVGVGHRGGRPVVLRDALAGHHERDPFGVVELVELAVPVVLADEIAVVGGEHQDRVAVLTGRLQGRDRVGDGTVDTLERLDPLLVDDPVRQPRRGVQGVAGAPDAVPTREQIRCPGQQETREPALVGRVRDGCLQPRFGVVGEAEPRVVGLGRPAVVRVRRS